MVKRGLIFIITLFFITVSAYSAATDKVYYTKRTVVIEGDLDFPPFEYLDDNGHPAGFNIDLLKTIFGRLNIKYTIKLDKWTNVIKDLKGGKADLVSMIYSNARAKSFKFGPLIKYTHLYAVYNEKKTPINMIEDLNNKNIIVEKGSIANEILTDMYKVHCHYIYSDNLADGLKDISHGKQDVLFCSYETSLYYCQKYNITNLKFIDMGILPQEYCFAGNNERLLVDIEKELYNIKKDGTYDDIYNKWFHPDHLSRTSRTIYIVIGSLFLLSLFLYIVNRILQNKIQKSKRILMEKNKSLSLLLHASNVDVWGYNIKSHRFYNIDGDYFPDRGMSLDDIVKRLHPDDRALFVKSINDASNGILPTSSLCLRIKNVKTGDWTYMDNEISAIYNEKGLVKNVVGTHKDITGSVMNRKRTENLLKKYQTVFNSTIIGIMYYDKDGCLSDMNEAACKMFGIIGKVNVLDKKILNIFNQPWYKERLDRNNIKPFKGIIEGSFDNLHKDKYFMFSNRKGPYIIETHVTPIFDSDNNLECIIVTDKDITDLMLTQHNLEKETERAQQSDKLKSLFVANMSHEIRTPLNAIVGFSNILGDIQDAEQKEQCVNLINKNNEILLNLVNDILDLSRMESGSIKLQNVAFDISEAMFVSFSSLKRLAEGRDIDFSYTVPFKSCIVSADKNRIMQVLTNFVINAFKYTEKGFIKMSYEYLDGGLKLMVSDSGSGISEENQNLIFERFEKLGSFKQGAGLGLSICKMIVDMYKGEIGVTSELGKGSTFWAFFPCKIQINSEKESSDNNK